MALLMILLDNKTDLVWSLPGDMYIYNYPEREKAHELYAILK
jgi:hypothetical protein